MAENNDSSLESGISSASGSSFTEEEHRAFEAEQLRMALQEFIQRRNEFQRALSLYLFDEAELNGSEDENEEEDGINETGDEEEDRINETGDEEEDGINGTGNEEEQEMNEDPDANGSNPFIVEINPSQEERGERGNNGLLRYVIEERMDTMRMGFVYLMIIGFILYYNFAN